MHLNKNHTFSRRALAMLLTLTLCLSLVPSAFAVSYTHLTLPTT